MKLIEMKTIDALSYLNAPKIAKHLNISRQAIYQWGYLVPEKSALLLAKKFPEIPHVNFIELGEKNMKK